MCGARLVALAGRRVGADGLLQIEARRFRTQEANRRDAVERLVGLIQRALERPKTRRARARPSLAAKARRLEAKRLHGQAKQNPPPARTGRGVAPPSPFTLSRNV